MRQLLAFAAVCSFLLAASYTGAQERDSDVELGKIGAALNGKDPAARAKAVDQLSRAGIKAKMALPLLVKALADESKDVRWRGARALGALGPDASGAVGALRKALADSDPHVRAYAAYALGSIGEKAQPAAPDLIKAAVDDDVIVRRAVLGALPRIKVPHSMTVPLIAKLMQAADPEMVTAMVRMLAEAGDEAVPLLVDGLQDKRTVYWAALALREIGPKAKAAVEPLTDVLKKSDEPEVRMQAALALAAIGPAAKSAVPALAGALEKDDFGGPRFAAAYALGEIGVAQGAVKALDKASQEDIPFLALISAGALARLEPDNKERSALAVKLIVEGLTSKDPQLRSAAARALVTLKGQPDVVAPALVAALADTSAEVIGNAIDALAAGGDRFVPAVSLGLKTEKLRMLATRILSRIGPEAKAAVPELVKALAVDDPQFKREVQFTLGAIGPAAAPAVPELIKSLDSDDEQVRNSAVYALGKIGPEAKEALPALRKNMSADDVDLKRFSLWATLKIDKGNASLAKAALPALIEGLSNERELVRYEAALALGEIGDLAKPAAGELKKSAQADSSPYVRDAAAEALKNLEK